MVRQVVKSCFLIALFASAMAAAHPCPCDGDANLDGVLDADDFALTLSCLGQTPIFMCSDADINCNGFIDSDDIDPDDPFNAPSAIVCLFNGNPPEECCPGVVTCGAAIAGDCFESNGTPACNDLDCCTAVCSSDSFCCNFLWDPFCAAAALEVCDAPGDCDGDSDVDLIDYSTLVGCATGAGGGGVPDGCNCADIDNDGDIDLNDFRRFQVLFSGSP